MSLDLREGVEAYQRMRRGLRMVDLEWVGRGCIRLLRLQKNISMVKGCFGEVKTDVATGGII
jgi:hypothetical protein